VICLPLSFGRHLLNQDLKWIGIDHGGGGTSKYAKIRFWAQDAPLDALVSWGVDTPPHTLSHMAPTHFRRSPCAPPPAPQNSSQIYVYPQMMFMIAKF